MSGTRGRRKSERQLAWNGHCNSVCMLPDVLVCIIELLFTWTLINCSCSVFNMDILCDACLKLQEKFIQFVGYDQLLLSLRGLGQPSDDLLDATLEMVST